MTLKDRIYSSKFCFDIVTMNDRGNGMSQFGLK
jgi:hypothetical protein